MSPEAYFDNAFRYADVVVAGVVAGSAVWLGGRYLRRRQARAEV